MARRKATVMLDRSKVEAVQALIGAATISDALEHALDRVLSADQLHRDIVAYRRQAVEDGELGLGDLPVEFDLDDDDVDYEALYGKAK